MSALSFQQADVIRVLQSEHTKWLILGVNLLLVLWIASLLASLTWDLVAPQADSLMDDAVTRPLPVAADPNAQLLRQLPDWHLMGVVVKQQAQVAVETPIDAPDTRLKLVLHGVLSSDRPGMARAIIADPKGEEEQYAVGDRLPGDVELSEVYPDRVILKRNGRFETLRLIQDNPAVGIVATRPAVSRLSARQEQVFKELREKIEQSPITLLGIVTPKPYMGEGNKMIGYELQPGTETDLFNDLGLQAGDVALQINDVRLETTQSGMQALKSIQSGDTAMMTILRDGQEQVINLTMP